MSSPEIIHFHYVFSPYAHKVSAYLDLRKLPYKQCMQPMALPRPDLQSLGITYRRIPLLSINNEVFCDTRLILDELERRFPEGKLGNDEWKKWQKWADTLFPAFAGSMPLSLPVLKDEKWLKDRMDYAGRSFAPDNMEKARPKALERVTGAFDHVEGILKDGRKWISGTEGVTLSDIVSVWPLEWLTSLPGTFEGTRISKEAYPNTFAWIARFKKLLPAKPRKDNIVSGEEAKKTILSKWKPMSGAADMDTSLGIQFGEEVEVVPIDTGKAHPQKGRVRGLTRERVVLEVVPTNQKNGDAALRVIFPREGFEIRSCSAKGNARL